MERLDRRSALVLLAIGGLVALAIVIGLASAGQQGLPRQVEAFAVPYHMRVIDDPLESMIVRSDGQAFATLARDPLLRRAAEEFRTPGAAAYRAQRPLGGHLAWALSLGQPGWVPPAMAVTAVAGTAAAVLAAGALLRHRGADPRSAAFILLIPGFYTTIAYLGPDPLALALAIGGVVMWERGRIGPAVVLFSLAALGRETMLIAPGVLFLCDVVAGRRSRLAPMVVPPLVWATWVGLVWWRIGALPTAEGDGALALPFRGVVAGLTDPILPGGHIWALAFLLVGVLAAVRAPRDHLTGITLAYLAFGTMMGQRVWVSWEYFGRILMPAAVFGILAVFATWERVRLDGLEDRSPQRVV